MLHLGGLAWAAPPKNTARRGTPVVEREERVSLARGSIGFLGLFWARSGTKAKKNKEVGTNFTV